MWMRMEELALSLFPFPSTYSIQRDFIHNFVKIVEGGTEEISDAGANVGILESPTGTVQTILTIIERLKPV